MAREQHEEENALVIWNISNCPIPVGHDPLQVVPRIQTALEKLRRDRPYDADNKLETTSRLIFSYRLDRGTGESPWSCSVCHFDAPSFEDFTKHLKSETHAYFVWDLVASKNKVDRTNPDNLQLGRSEEWDLLAKAGMMRRAEVLKLRGAFAPPRSRPVDANSFKEPFKSGE
ncbi:hypothetical protein HID58_005693 [Brassica napus]|uniref:Uncharacterized protein n=1 Tax=Brassica napus TaxID=3708 RepID=A0ABQ8E9A8_BRANA|nr:hypothetical protein HID58_005693 [Brassica napus]